MTNDIDTLITDKYLNCYGNFNMADEICKNHCILCLRCIVEKNQNARMEIFEEMMASDVMPIRLQ